MTVTWESASRTHAGNKRAANEDALLIHPDGILWAVADGMGGHEAGDVASGIIVEELQSISATQSTLEQFLAQTQTRLQLAASRIQQYATEHCAGRKIGSTLVCLLAQNDSLACIWAGDSRLYRLRRGSLQQLTEDHSEVAKLVALGLITEEEARTHPNKNVITRTIGAGSARDFEYCNIEFESGDLFLLCSDGLYDELDDADIVTSLHAETLEEMAADLLHRSLLTAAEDNISFIILRGVKT